MSTEKSVYRFRVPKNFVLDDEALYHLGEGYNIEILRRKECPKFDVIKTNADHSQRFISDMLDTYGRLERSIPQRLFDFLSARRKEQ